MKNIKKLKSYGKAVATSALLIGATVTGAAGLAAAQNSGSSGMSLHDYPSPFVDDEGNVDTSIVVGSNGQQADVVSAVDIAGDLGNSAFEETSVSGSAGAVDGEALDEVTVGTALGDTTIDASDYSMFVRETMEDDDNNDVFVTESANINGDVDSRINGTTTDLEFGSNDVSYTVKYSPGFEANDTVVLLGEEYELTEVVSDSEIELGSTLDNDVQVGDDFDHGPFTVEVTGQTSGDDPNIVVRVSEGEETLDTFELDDGDEETVGDDDEFTVRADTVIFYDDGTSDITLETTYTDTTLEEGEDLEMDDRYQVASSGIVTNGEGVLQSIKVDNNQKTVDDPEDEDEIAYVESGESFQGPNNYFSLTNQGLTDETMTDVEFGTETEVTFTDVNNQEHTVDMSEIVDGTAGVQDDEDMYVTVDSNSDATGDSVDDFYLVEVSDVGTSNEEVTLAHNEFEKTFTLDDASGGASSQTQTVSTGYGFDITVDFAGSNLDASSPTVNSINVQNTGTQKVTTQNGAELTLTTNEDAFDAGTEGTDVTDGASDGATTEMIQVEEASGVESTQDTGIIQVYYEGGSDYFNDADDGDIGAVYYEGQEGVADGATTVLGDVEDGDSTLSHFGSGIELDSSSAATVMYPDEQRYQLAALGAVGEGTSGSVSMMPTGFPSGTGTLDSDVSNSERDQNMILVGGPEVNGLTADLADEGSTWNSSQYENNQGVGVLDLVEDAFSDGYSALVVAGWNAEDTTAAADYLVDYNPETDTALEDRTTVQVNTDSGELVE